MYPFITPSIAELAIDRVMPAIKAMMAGGEAKRSHLHIVVGLQDDYDAEQHVDVYNCDFGDGEHYYVVTERSVGERDEWEHEYDAIARGKADKSARTGLDTRVMHTVRRDTLRRGDIRYWGSVIKGGVVVACSGVQPYIDELFAKWILAAIEALIEDMLERGLPDDTDCLEVLDPDNQVA